MAITVNTNLTALLVQSNLKQASNNASSAMQRMTTGYKINHAKDNAAGYSIATKMSVKLSSLKQAEDNASMGLDMMQTVSSALDTMSNLTSRLRALATQAQNETYGSSSLDALNSEASAIVQELYRIKNTTEYNGINLLNGAAKISTNSQIDVHSKASPSTSASFIKQITRRDVSSLQTFDSVDSEADLSAGVYSISSAQELAKLATMTNNGKINSGVEFVLANDIDLSSYSNWTPIGAKENSPFLADFDGNGYQISNISTMAAERGGFFGVAKNSNIKNLGIENFHYSTKSSGGIGGALAACIDNGTVQNCFVSGGYIDNTIVGGLIGLVNNTVAVENCFAKIDVLSDYIASGFIGCAGQGAEISIDNSFSSGIVVGICAQGFLGLVNCSATISNSYSINEVTAYLPPNSYYDKAIATGFVNNSSGNSSSNCKINNSYFAGTVTITGDNAEKYEFVLSEENLSLSNAGKITLGELNNLIAKGKLLTNNKVPIDASKDVMLDFQIGINGNDDSQINLNLSSIDISSLDGLKMNSTNALKTIDEVLKNINEQQTQIGAVENRLTSALDSISISYENLLSSHSTLRDADIAKESSAYIRNQILLDASATLLATANQSPAIALQLIQGR